MRYVALHCIISIKMIIIVFYCTIVLLQLREKGEIASLRKKWWDEKSECIKTETKKDDSSTASLGLENLGGVFIILLGGVICALVLLIVEVRCKRVVDYLTKSQVWTISCFLGRFPLVRSGRPKRTGSDQFK